MQQQQHIKTVQTFFFLHQPEVLNGYDKNEWWHRNGAELGSHQTENADVSLFDNFNSFWREECKEFQLYVNQQGKMKTWYN